jgi:hypothetical protein
VRVCVDPTAEQVFRGRVIGPGASIVSTLTPALRSCAATA